MKSSILFPIIMIILLSSSLLFAEEKQPTTESSRYSAFKTIERFGIIKVTTMGTAEKLGLKQEALTEYLKLKFKNNFAGIEFKDTEFNELPELINDFKKRQKIGAILVKVWTVGEDYPVALYLSISAGYYLNYRIYENAYLGYGSKESMPKEVKEKISDLIEGLAISFFKARGTL